MMQKTFTFAELPQNEGQLAAMAGGSFSDPLQTAALTAAVLCRYGTDRDACIAMLNMLRGPRPLSQYEIQFLRDRLGGKEYKPFSFFAGATPANNYTPAQPYAITAEGEPLPNEPDYFRVMLRSGGADHPRPVTLRRKGEEWLLWEEMLLADIRTPAKDDPWA